ncbi:MAG: hypothetical protein H0U54_01085 [Acidobacteria bacterium]|nr:hypothetical protein [Acidobacteriota bacterium]
MELPDRKGVLVENPDRLDKDKFVKLALAEFPQLREEFAEDDGLLHLQMAAFSRFAQAAIDRNDLDVLVGCYAFLAEVMKSAASDVENAIYVSFLENLDFESSVYGAEAKRLLPPALQKALAELNEHWENTGKRQVESQDNQQRAREERARKK